MLMKYLLPLLALTLPAYLIPQKVFAQSSGDIIFTEVMYNSPDTDEWIEIYNTTGSSITLDTKWRLTYGSNTYDFTGISIGSGSYVTVGLGSDGDGTFNNSNSFTPTVSAIGANIASVNDPNNLDDGTTLKISYDPNGVNTTIDEITFTTNSPWNSAANGDGVTLELSHTSLDNSNGANWQGSTLNGGTPTSTNSKFLTSNTGSVSLSTASNWTYASSFNAAPTSVDNVTVSSGHTLTVNSSASIHDLTVEGTVSVTSGTFNTHKITVNSGGDITNSATLSFNDFNQNNGGEIILGSTVNLDQGGSCDLTTGEIIFTGDVYQSNSTDLNIGASARVTIANRASLITTSGGFTGSPINIEKTGLSNTLAYNIWSSPVSSADIVTTFPGANPCDIYVYDEINQLWRYDYTNNYSTTCNGNAVTFTSGSLISGADGVMDVARGYYAPGNATTTRVFAGTPNTGNINFTMGTSGDAWNLIGNPYPCSVDLDEVITTNSSNFDGDFYFWVDDLGGGAGYANSDFATYNSSGGTAANGVTPTQYLGSGQGFWVKATAATFSFTNAHKVSGNNDVFYKTDGNNDVKRSWITLTNNDLSNQILVAFTSKATDGYDTHYDAIKWEGNADIFFASINDSDFYAIQGFPELTPNVSKIIPLEVKVSTTGMYMIQLDSTQNFVNNPDVYLEDVHLNKTHLLNNGAYNAYIDAAKDNKDRFYLHYNQTYVAQDSSGSVGTHDLEVKTSIQSTVSEGTIQLETNSLENQINRVQIIDVQGRIILDNSNYNSRVIQLQHNLTTGVYFLRINLNNGKQEILKTILN